MKLAIAAIQLAATDGDTGRILQIFADYFGVPALLSIDTPPTVRHFSIDEHWLTDYGGNYPMVHVIVNYNYTEYRCDYEGLTARLNHFYAHPFTILHWHANPDTSQS